MGRKLTELAVEIYDSLFKFGEFLIRYRLEGDRHAEHEMRMATAANLVRHIGEAYADGLGLPGELGRAAGMEEFENLRFKIWLDAPDGIDYDLEGYRFIAFPPKGKEE